MAKRDLKPARTTSEVLAWMKDLKGEPKQVIPVCAGDCTCRLCRSTAKLHTKTSKPISNTRAREIAFQVLMLSDLGATKIEIIPLEKEE